MWLKEQSLNKGFTIVEILVVLVIMSVMLGLVAANFVQDERQLLQNEAHRLALLMQHANETARTTGQPIAWQMNEAGYVFLQLDSDRKNWQILKGDAQLRQRELPENMKLKALQIAGAHVNADELIIFSPSGLNPAFNLMLSSERAQLNITGDMLGKVIDLPAQEI